jgi:hypothetical protein
MTGYATMREDTPPGSAARTTIVGGQTFQTIIRVYKPSAITVMPRNADGTAYVGQATATISSSRGTQSFSFTGGTFTLAPPATLAGEPIVPNVQYTARVLTATGAVATPLTQPVPNSYPTDLTKTFVVTLGAPAAMQPLTIRVVNAAGTRVPGATVTISGGPGSNVVLTATADSTGSAVFNVPSNSSPGYVSAATGGTLTGTASGAVTAPTTRTVTIR